MPLKENINKIHYDLVNKYGDSVSVAEKSTPSIPDYIEISINHNDKLLIMGIQKRQLENTSFNWFYKDNPLDTNAYLVERSSNTETLLTDIDDIFTKNKFNKKYLESK